MLILTCATLADSTIGSLVTVLFMCMDVKKIVDCGCVMRVSMLKKSAYFLHQLLSLSLLLGYMDSCPSWTCAASVGMECRLVISRQKGLIHRLTVLLQRLSTDRWCDAKFGWYFSERMIEFAVLRCFTICFVYLSSSRCNIDENKCNVSRSCY